MNDVTADTPGIESHGADVTGIGEEIASNIDGKMDSLDASTPGLSAPGAFASLVSTWSSHCQGVSSEVVTAGDGITSCGHNHDANENTQESAMNGTNPG